jgi:hypothetical protein
VEKKMSIFGSIMSKIFHHAEPAPAPTSPDPGPGADQAASAAPPADSTAPFADPAPAPAPGTTPVAPAAPATVDVAAILDDLASKNSETLDWKHSIVDMMKLLDLDSSLAARKELARELNYAGDTGDSASMNIWLHKQVMRKLAENGGTVPDDLKG